MADHTPTPESQMPAQTPTENPGALPGELPGAPPALNPNDALDLLGDLESRLGKLKAWQAENDKHAEQVRDQAQSIAQREQELADRQQSIDADRQTLELERESLATEKSRVEADRSELDAGRSELDGAREDFNAKEAALEQRTAALDERAGQIDGKIAELDTRQAELDHQQSELTEKQELVDAKWAEIKEAKQEIEDTRQQVDDLRATIEEDRQALDTDRTAFDAERAEFSEQRQHLKDRKQDLAKAQMDLKLRQDALEAQQQSLERARTELAEQAGQFGNDDTLMPGYIPDFDAETDSDNPAAAASTPQDNAELAAREAELLNAQAALEQDRQSFAEQVEQSKADVAAAREVVTADEKAVQELADELDQQQQALNNRQAQLDAQAEELDRLKAEFDERVDGSDTATGLVAAAPAEPDAAAPGDESTTQRASELDAAQAELDAEREVVAQRVTELDNIKRELDAREAQLDEREAELNARAATGETAGLDGDAKDEKILQLTTDLTALQTKYQRRKGQMLKADEVIKKRRDKVRGYLKQLREHSKNIQAAETKVDSSSAQYAGLDKERRNLVEVKKFLEASERAMVQKWATKSTVSVVSLVIIALLGAAAVSYFAAQKLAVPVWQSSMAISVRLDPSTEDLSPGVPSAVEDPAAAAFLAEQTGAAPAPATPEFVEPSLEPAVADAWLGQFRQLVTNPTVMNQTLNQLDQRGIRLFTSPTQLSAHFAQTLDIQGSPARVELAYTSSEQEHVVGILDALGKAIVSHQMSIDRAKGVSDSVKVLQNAQRNATAVQDDSLKYMGISFAAICGVALVLGLLIRVALGRSRRVMADAEDIPVLATLNKPGTWSPVSGDGENAA